jgi:hypothetical protein
MNTIFGGLTFDRWFTSIFEQSYYEALAYLC